MTSIKIQLFSNLLNLALPRMMSAAPARRPPDPETVARIIKVIKEITAENYSKVRERSKHARNFL
jgi:hypothetical protein